MTTAPSDIRNVAIIGHKGSGKTQLTEAMLYVAKATPKLGKVDDKSSVLDETIEEKEHACSLEASIAHLTWNGKKINVVDTPGQAGQWEGLGVGLTWRTPWSGQLTVGAENVITRGKNPFSPVNAETDEGTMPYVRYEQDL